MDSRKLMAWCLGWGCWIVNGPARADVWIVTKAPSGSPNEFAEIQPAIDAASDGDVILVRNGDYAPISIEGKQLSVVADAGQNFVRLASAGPGSSAISVSGLRGEQRVVLKGLNGNGIRFRDSLGSIWLESVMSLFGEPALAIERCRQVDVVSSILTSTSTEFDPEGNPISRARPGVEIVDSHVVISRSSVVGGSGGGGFVSSTGAIVSGTRGQSGLEMQRGTLRLQQCSVLGGSAGGSIFDASTGVCTPTYDGATALTLIDVDAALIACDVMGGAGGIGDPGFCPTGEQGLVAVTQGGTLSWAAGALHDLRVSTPIREGSHAGVEVFASPNEVALIFAATRLASQPMLDPMNFSVLSPHAWLVAIPALSATSGSLLVGQVSAQVPALPPGVDAFEIFLEASFCGPAECTWMPGAQVLVIDSRFTAP